MGEFDNAITALKKGKRRFKLYPAPSRALAFVYRTAKNFSAALQEYGELKKYFPFDPLGWSGSGRNILGDETASSC